MSGPRPDWTAIAAEYAVSTISTRELAAKWGVPYSTLRSRAEREHWTEARADHRRKAGAELAQNAISEQTRQLRQLLAASGNALSMANDRLNELMSSGRTAHGGELASIARALKTLNEILINVQPAGEYDVLSKARQLLAGVPDKLDGDN